MTDWCCIKRWWFIKRRYCFNLRSWCWNNKARWETKAFFFVICSALNNLRGGWLCFITFALNKLAILLAINLLIQSHIEIWHWDYCPLESITIRVMRYFIQLSPLIDTGLLVYWLNALRLAFSRNIICEYFLSFSRRIVRVERKYRWQNHGRFGRECMRKRKSRLLRRIQKKDCVRRRLLWRARDVLYHWNQLHKN